MQELYHYGIPGQKWGVRRFQNPDGSLTEAGLKRYSSKEDKLLKKAYAPFYKGIRKNGFAGRETARSRKAVLKLNKIRYVPRAKIAKQIAQDEGRKRAKEQDDAANYMINKYGRSDRTYEILERIDTGGSLKGIKFKSKTEKKDWEEYRNKVEQNRKALDNLLYVERYIAALLGSNPVPVYTFVGKGEEYVLKLMNDPQYSKQFKGVWGYD